MDVFVDNICKDIVKKCRENERKYSERNNSPSVVAAVINIELHQNESETIQFIDNLKPGYWQGNLTGEVVQYLMGKETEDA